MEKIVVDLLNRLTDGFIKDSGEMDFHDYETQEQRSWQQHPEEPTRRSNKIKLENKSCLKETNHSC